MRRWLLASLTLLLLPGVAYAVPVPSPDMGFGVAGLGPVFSWRENG
jgi:hypothetical protein